MTEPRIVRLVSHLDDSGGNCRRAWAAAVVAVDSSASDLEPLMALGERLGDQLGRRLLDMMAGAQVSAYGKSAIVGSACEIEHAAAILHPRLGKPLRQLLGGGKAIIPSTVKKGAPGTTIDVPLHGKNDEWDFSLLDSIEAAVGGAPADSEVVVIVALAAGGRAHARIGVRQ